MKLAGKLPAGDGNGLTTVVDDMIAQAIGTKPKQLYVAVCLVDCAKITTNADTGETVPTARIRRIEIPLTGEDKELAQALMRRALDARTGREALPYDLEKEIRGVFDAATGHTVDPESGEVGDDDPPDDDTDAMQFPDDDEDDK